MIAMIRSFICILGLFQLSGLCQAQITAITERGDTIYVFNDGTWSFYEDGGYQEETGLEYLDMELTFDSTDQVFTIPSDSKSNIKSALGFFDINYNDKKWKRVPAGKFNEDAEIAFESKEKDMYAIIISEEIEIGAENIVKIALNNMEETMSTPPEVKLLQKRVVNGQPLIRAVYAINVSGMDLTFDSYYYSDFRGTIQFTTWTGSNLHGKYEKDIVDLLNGILIEK